MTLPVSSRTRTSRIVVEGIGAAAALARRQVADAVREDRAIRRHRQFFDHGQRGVGFEPGDDAALRGIEFGPPRIVVIAQIKDKVSTGLTLCRVSLSGRLEPFTRVERD